MSIKKRLERLEGGQAPAYVSIWDVICGAAEMPADIDRIDPRHREMAEQLARPRVEVPDPLEEVFRRAGLEELEEYREEASLPLAPLRELPPCDGSSE